MSTRLVVAVAGACGLFLLAGCRFDSSGLPASGRKVIVPVVAKHCPIVIQPMPVSLDSPQNQYPQVKSYQVVQKVLDNGTFPQPIYIQGDVVIKDIGYPLLKGAVLIETSLADSGNSAEEFLQLTPHNDALAFYIAYDARAHPPAWLAGPDTKYKPEIDPTTNAPYFITTTLTDLATKEPVRLALWRRTEEVRRETMVPIPGNDSGSPGWGSIPQGNRAMYIVLIRPYEYHICSSPVGQVVATDLWSDCVTSDVKTDEEHALDRGTTMAIDWCEDKYRGLTCEPTVIHDSLGRIQYPWVGPYAPECTLTITGVVPLSVGPRGFNVDSEIEFLSPQSQAVVTLQGKPYATAVSGNLYFEYLLQTHDLRVNEMRLQLAPLATDAGTFQNINSTLATFATAHCQDSMPVYNQPCTHYRVPPGEFVTGESFEREGKAAFIAAANDQPIDISINHSARTFQVGGGPLSTTLDLGGNPVPVTLALNLTGHFVNFAPIAVGRESTKFTECTENTNDRPVLLSAAGSFDVYDTLPANPTTYQWYEDYGRITEKSRGQAKTVTLAPHQLAFGVHSFTLVVHDKNGVAGTDTVSLTVGDSKPPSLSIPPDVLVLQPASAIGPQKVDLGQAGGSDACSMKAVITNDAPPGLVFQPGVTSVTWTADDRRGNLVTKVQKVSLLEALPPGKADYKQRVALLAGIAGQFEASLRACGGADECRLDLSLLHRALDDLAAATRAQPGWEDRQRVVSVLDRARRSVAEIETTVAESNAKAGRRARLRAAAIRRAVELTLLLQQEAR